MADDDSTDFHAEAVALDEADPLAALRDRYLVPEGTDLVAYFDGNSLGRPVAAAADRLVELVHGAWGDRLIRSWDEQWLDWPVQVGDRIARTVLGSGPGQTVVADSTTVLLYKLSRAAADLQASRGRTEIVLDTDNFPTDRYVVEGIAAERGGRVRWIETEPDSGVTLDQVREAVGPRTALALFSHVAYRSAHLADAPGITRAVHDAGGLVLWDLSHSVGSVELDLDGWGVDLAVGCTYKYLCGGPGAPAFGYLAARHQGVLRQPVQGWMGHAEPFTMGPGYTAATGARALLSGTPPIVAMVPVRCGLDLVERVGMAAIRAKSVRLTRFALDLADDLLDGAGVTVASPRDDATRGGHVTLRRADFRAVNDRLWDAGVIGDFRAPDGIRIGLAPLSTSFAEVLEGMLVLAREVAR